MQLPLHCGLLWGLLQRWGDQHLYGAYGERQRLLAGPTTNEHRTVVVGYQYVVFLNDENILNVIKIFKIFVPKEPHAFFLN